jgi:hypothetical protein
MPTGQLFLAGCSIVKGFQVRQIAIFFMVSGLGESNLSRLKGRPTVQGRVYTTGSVMGGVCSGRGSNTLCSTRACAGTPVAHAALSWTTRTELRRAIAFPITRPFRIPIVRSCLCSRGNPHSPVRLFCKQCFLEPLNRLVALFESRVELNRYVSDLAQIKCREILDSYLLQPLSIKS